MKMIQIKEDFILDFEDKVVTEVHIFESVKRGDSTQYLGNPTQTKIKNKK